MLLFIMWFSYLCMITTNILANLLPINGMSTAAISNQYPVLFTPAGYVFSIWGLIYIGLFVLLISYTRNKKLLTSHFAVLFSLSSVANIAWLISWHYQKTLLSLLVMVVLLVILMLLFKEHNRSQLSDFFLMPISLYLGWITVALIANLFYYFVKNGLFPFLGFQETTWTMVFLGIGTIIALVVRIKWDELVYALVFVWAFLGIFFKNSGGNMTVAYFALFCAIVIFLFSIRSFFGKSYRFIVEKRS